MKKLTANQIRNMWLEFFRSKGHHVEKGASLIPYNDPTLLWINSGVAALKKYMDGSEVPPSRRITNVQKSIRTNDIDNVGYTARHHTFFEMLGCFSIGDYFRKEIIEWAYEILTSPKWFDLPKEKLYFTYNPSDLDTFELWQKQGVDKSHLIALEGNYWEIGEGPCGPNTEVFFDRGDKWDPEHLGVKLLEEEIENDRYIEIWGIVFSQFNAQPGKKRSEYKELPSKNIDTGAGLERIVSIIQEADSNFETDLFLPLIKQTESLANVPYNKSNLTPYRVIADHVRAVSFALGDGESFSNEGRGYILRRLVRRALRYGRKIGIEGSFLYKLVPTVFEINKEFYPEYLSKVDEIASKVKDEEEKFLKTLVSGEKILRELIENKSTLSGKDAFLLYDTFGFPLDITKEICAENNVKVDEEGFNKEMEEQKERARNARVEINSMHKQSKDLLEFNLPSEFIYEHDELVSKVIGVFKDGDKVDEITDYGEVIFDRTNFYAESGGEVADNGELINSTTLAFVNNVQKAPNKENLHFVKIAKGSIKVGDTLTLKLDVNKRVLIERNHSATHLLQSMINKVLNTTVKQMGSFVSSEYLRFDFSYNQKISENELNAIEREVNNLIAASIPSDIVYSKKEEALGTGAKSFFMDKYGDTVRVVSFGDVSKEFCGGAHVKNTSEIGLFTIVKEESIASGVRRIEAKTSLGAYSFIKEKEALLIALRDKLNAKSIYEASGRLNALLSEKDNLVKENQKLNDKFASMSASNVKNEFEEVNGVKFLFKYLEGYNANQLMKLGDEVKVLYPNFAIVLVGGANDNLPLVSFMGGEVISKINAGNLLRQVAQVLGGSAGGRDNMANGRGKDLSKLDEAKNKAKELIK